MHVIIYAGLWIWSIELAFLPVFGSTKVLSAELYSVYQFDCASVVPDGNKAFWSSYPVACVCFNKRTDGFNGLQLV